MIQEQYYEKLRKIKSISRKGMIDIDTDKWAKDNKTDFNEMLTYKKQNTLDEDAKSNGYILQTKLFKQYTNDDQYLIAQIIIDIEKLDSDIKIIEDYKKKYEAFSNSQYGQNLYTKIPELANYFRETKGKEELIDYSEIAKHAYSIDYYKIDNLFFRTCLYPYGVIRTIIEDYGKKGYKLFVRLDHTFCDINCDLSPIQEGLVRPPNPKWVENMMIYTSEGAAYELYKSNDDEIDIIKKCYKDLYYLKGVRKLEVTAKRESNGHFSMMIEELVELSDAVLLGNCIHCDSTIEIGTNCNSVILNHIDFAENIYTYDTAKQRMLVRLDQEKIPNATLRGHLFRIESVPFLELPNIVYLCCYSKFLVEDWVKAQFKKQ